MENQIMDPHDLENADPWGGFGDAPRSHADPESMSADANRIIDDANASSAPKPPEPATDLHVELAGGIFVPGQGQVNTVEVRELDGFAEEKLARVTDIGEYKTKLIELGVVSVGGRPVESPEILQTMLLGDRDTVILAIRRATFGDEMDLELTCRSCGEEQEVTYRFSAIEVRDLRDNEMSFEWKLRDGRVATVRLPQADDENEVVKATKNKSATMADANTVMLMRLVETINGMPVTLSDEVKRLGMKDRRDLLNEIYERRVGPDFESVTYACANCGVESPLVIGVFEMFR